MAFFALLALATARGAAADAPPVGTEAGFVTEQLAPFLTAHCVKCHAGPEPVALLMLDQVGDAGEIIAHRERWERVLEQLEAGSMPPEDEPRPDPTKLQTISAWLRAEFAKADQMAADPGRVTIRRLNRAEYNNTIRDLVGVTFQPAEDFPADEVGYGFDNIGDVLSMPPVLLEKYLAAAERIVSESILVAPPGPVTTRFEAEQQQATVGSLERDCRILSSTGEVFFQFPAPEAGDYVIHVRAYGHQAGDEKAKMALRVEDHDVQTIEVAALESAPAIYDTRVHFEAGQHRVAASFLNDYFKPDDPDPNNRDRNLVIDYFEIVGPVDVVRPYPEPHRRVMVCQPTAGATDAERAECARAIFERFATRAYRRPATAGEVARLVELVRLAAAEGDSFERGIQLAMTAVLVSPNFLFRVELDDRAPPGETVHAIDEFELASRLSYFLWSSMPDEELFGLAAAGRLRQRDELERQARRMLTDPKAATLFDNFATQWLQLRNLQTVSPNPKQFSTFDPALREAMLTETRLLFETVRREDRSVLEFLDADFTFVNEALAKHYGLPDVEGEDFRRVSTAGTPRGGFLTQASVLTITSNPTRTSPVKRGKWVLEQLLGAAPPPPPPNVPELPDDKAGPLTGTLRQRMEQHRANPSCGACHSRLDPLGFGLENFDAIGAWRDKDADTPIDASGTLPDGTTFAGPGELKGILKGKAGAFRSCLAEKMLTYAIGRGTERFDRPAIDKICTALAADGDRFSRLVLEIVRSEPFQLRRAIGATE